VSVELDFEITEQVDHEPAVVAVRGEIDLSSAPELRSSLLKQASEGRTMLVIDLSGVTFIDSTGLSVLLSGMKRLREAGGDLLLVIADPQILRVFEITGLTGLFRILPDLAAARAAALEHREAPPS